MNLALQATLAQETLVLLHSWRTSKVNTECSPELLSAGRQVPQLRRQYPFMAACSSSPTM